MEVTDYELFEIPPGLLFLKLTTSDGETGWGEPTNLPYSRTVKAATTEVMEKYLLGEDPLRIGDHWQAMYRGGYHRDGPILMSAIAGIEQALWDIKGNHYGAPVYEFLGGQCRDRVRVYQRIGGDRPEHIASEAERAVEEGFSAVKIDATERLAHIDAPAVTDHVRQRVEAVQEAVGDEVGVCVDFRGRASKTMARRLVTHLEPYDLLFVEEPLRPEDIASFPDLARHTATPLAIGERLYSRWDFKPLLDTELVDVVQPDISRAGGISESMRIAQMAETSGAAVSQIRPRSPLALAATIQVSASIPNHLIHDYGFPGQEEVHDYFDYSAFSLEDGYVNIPDGPGLNVDIDEDRVRELDAIEVDQPYPLRRHPDGSVAEF
ncbi:galactonate dehydratase [Saliphagus infecundisoli]|uniref:Galactonate dehydratase n=1 Tax=Saliphagus infecundisoli TaxID=1849069 RepID=A0ABD5QB58_9EURY|nr:galactonate dehydratase [Saliphagus infecundisoli]